MKSTITRFAISQVQYYNLLLYSTVNNSNSVGLSKSSDFDSH